MSVPFRTRTHVHPACSCVVFEFYRVEESDTYSSSSRLFRKYRCLCRHEVTEQESSCKGHLGTKLMKQPIFVDYCRRCLVNLVGTCCVQTVVPTPLALPSPGINIGYAARPPKVLMQHNRWARGMIMRAPQQSIQSNDFCTIPGAFRTVTTDYSSFFFADRGKQTTRSWSSFLISRICV